MTTVYVCRERDIECGRNPNAWCASCPQRATTQPRVSDQADERRAKFDAWYAQQPMPDLLARMDPQQAAFNAWQAATKQGAPEAPTEPLCPACQGSGEGVMMEGQGPDAYEVPCNCPHCNGTGGLLDAYNGLVALLAAEREKYLRLCGKIFFAAPEAPTLRDWLAIIHDKEYTMGDRLQRISSRIQAILCEAAPEAPKKMYGTIGHTRIPGMSPIAPVAAAVRATERIDAMHKGVVGVLAAIRDEALASPVAAPEAPASQQAGAAAHGFDTGITPWQDRGLFPDADSQIEAMSEELGELRGVLRGVLESLSSAATTASENRAAFRSHLQQCSAEVATWPDWKRASVTASASVDWENGLTQLLENYKHATDHGINSRESVQERVIAYVLTGRTPTSSPEAAPQIKTWLERMGPNYIDGGADLPEEVAMKAEIAELRAALAQQGAAQAAHAGADQDGERWRFMMAVADNNESPEAKAMELFARDPDDDDSRPESVQFAEMVDKARAAMSAATEKEPK